jgi:acetyltransferase-like isoleucine patch superfamily enzyme
MTILGVMNNLSHTSFDYTENITTDPTYFDSRCCNMAFDLKSYDSSTVYSKLAGTFTPVSDFWVHFDIFPVETNYYSRRLFAAYENGQSTITIGIFYYNNNEISIYAYDSSGNSHMLTAVHPQDFIGRLNTLDFHFRIQSNQVELVEVWHENDQTGGRVNIGNGTWSGTPLTTSVDKISIGSRDNTFDYLVYMSQVCIADEDTRGLKVVDLAPDSDAGPNEWNGGYDKVSDEDAINVYHSVSSSNVGDESFFGISDVHNDFNNGSVKAVFHSFSGRSTGAENAVMTIRQGATSEDENHSPLESTLKSMVVRRDTDISGNQWNITSLNNLEIGLKVTN